MLSLYVNKSYKTTSSQKSIALALRKKDTFKAAHFLEMIIAYPAGVLYSIPDFDWQLAMTTFQTKCLFYDNKSLLKVVKKKCGDNNRYMWSHY